jgi:phosphatidylcholine synthase
MAALILAWLVHLYTALGALVGLFAILAIDAANFRLAFFFMAVAIAIDATDGTLARAARVKELLPWFDGTLLDNLVDYLNYVIVPCLALLRASLLPPQDALWLAALPVISSAYGFCQRDAKTADHFFLGFPSYWNIVVFYLYALRSPLWINAFLIIALSILIFVPLRFIYPSRAPRFRAQTNFFGALWGVIILYVIYRLPEPSPGVLSVSLIYPAYYTILSMWLELQRMLDANRSANQIR